MKFLHMVRVTSAAARWGVVVTVCSLVAQTFLFEVAFAATFYVSPQGSDSNPGSETAPWASLTNAASKVVAGDTVVVKGGTYYTNPILLMQSGSVGAPITFRAAGSEKVVLDGSRSSDAQGDVFSVLGDHFVIEGFEVRNAKRVGINVWGGKHVAIRRNRIHGSFWNGIYTGNGASDIEIQGNVISDNVQSARLNNKTSWRGGVGLNNGSDVRVLDNEIFENYGEGLDVYLMRDVEVRGNRFHDNFAAQLYLDNVEGAVAEGNFIYTNYNPDFYRSLYNNNGPSPGIEVANESPNAPLLSQVVIRNNIVVGGVYQFIYWKGVGQGMKNLLVANNTFVKGERLSNGVLHIDSDSLTTNVRFANNIFFSRGGSIAEEWNIPGTLSGVTFDHNTWYGGSYPSRVSGTGDLVRDPLFSNPAGTAALDFKLRGASPAIDSGVSLGEVSNDYFGGKRPEGGRHDQGAHEYSGVAPTPTVRPTVTSIPTPRATATPRPTPPVATPTPRPTSTPEQACKVGVRTSRRGSQSFSARVTFFNTGGTSFRDWSTRWTTRGNEKVTSGTLPFRQSGKTFFVRGRKGSEIAPGQSATFTLSGRVGRGTPFGWSGFQMNGISCRTR